MQVRHGWLVDSNTLAFMSASQGGMGRFLWLAEGQSPMRLLQHADERHLLVGAVSHGLLAFAVQPMLHSGATDGVVALWRPGDEAPTLLGDATGILNLHIAPDGKRLLLCIGDDVKSYSFALWNGTRLVDGGSGACAWHAWSETGVLAVGNEGSFARVVDAEGKSLFDLPRWSLPLGWREGQLYSFTPVDEQMAQWQLRRGDGASTHALGQPVTVRLLEQRTASSLLFSTGV